MQPKYSALFTSVNLLLGVGPLIIPMPFFDAGIVLSIIWMIIICLLSYNSAMFISESMSKLHQIVAENDQVSFSENDLVKQTTFNDSLITTKEQDLTGEEANSLTNNKNLQLDHSDQFEILFGKKWALFPIISITIYLLGTSVSKCIMTAKTMAKLFEGREVLQEYTLWIFVFFISGAVFSFRSIDKTKVMQATIIGVRTVSIVLLIAGALFLIFKEGAKNVTPTNGGVFNPSEFVELFSNSVFALMFHHSFPSIVNNLKTTEEVRFVVKNAFLISGSVLLIIPITGILAFGQALKDKDPNGLKYYNMDFQGKIDFIYWFTSFYVFLNIAAFSVYIIVIRTNVLRIIYPKIDAKKLSIHTVIASAVILTIIVIMAWQLQNQIKIVLDFTGGIFGIIILFIIPCMEVYASRNKIHRQGNPRNYIRYLPIILGALGLLFMGFNLFHIISDIIKRQNPNPEML